MSQYDVFLSYSRTDIEVMRRVATLLQAHGARVWVDEELEVGSPNWTKIVERAISGSRSMVAILSPEAKQSEWVLAEIGRAKMNDIQIFPLLIRGEPRDSIPFGLEHANWMDARTNLLTKTEVFALEVCRQLGINSTANLMRQVQDLQRELKSQQEQQETFQQQIAEKDAMITTLQSKLNQQDANLSQLADKLFRLESDNYALQDQLENLRSLTPDPDTPMARFVAWAKEQENAIPANRRTREVASIADHAEFESIYTVVKDTQSKLERTQQMLALASDTPHLRAGSVLDWFILLWWYFFHPYQIQRHLEVYGEDSLRSVRSWLASTLIWGALMIPLIGAYFGTIGVDPNFNIFGYTLASPIWIFGAIIAWAVMGIFGREDGGGLGFTIALLATGMVTGFMAFAIIEGLRPGEWVALAFFIVLGVLFTVRGIAAFLMAFVVTFVLAGSLTLGLPSISLLGSALVATLLISALITQLLSDSREPKLFSIHTIFSGILFSIFLGTYLFLAGVYWMGLPLPV